MILPTAAAMLLTAAAAVAQDSSASDGPAAGHPTTADTIRPIVLYNPPPATGTAAGVDWPIGIVVPGDAPERSPLARGAALAVGQFNAAGGIGGKPARLVVRSASKKWGSAAEAYRELTYTDGCLALLTPAGGEAAHLAGLVAAKGHVPILSLSPEPSVAQIPVPWVFLAVPDTRQEINALFERLPPGTATVAAITGPTRDDREFVDELRLAAAIKQLAVGPTLQTPVPPTPVELDRLQAQHAAPCLVRNPAGVERGLSGIELRLPATLDIPARRFGVLMFDPDTPAAAAFVQAYRGAYDTDPDEAAARAYDATQTVLAAFSEAAGIGTLDRTTVREALLSPDGQIESSVAGLGGFDHRGRRTGPLRVVESLGSP